MCRWVETRQQSLCVWLTTRSVCWHIELFNAAQALEMRRPLKSSPAIEAWHAEYRKVVPYIDNDTVMSPLIAATVEFLRK